MRKVFISYRRADTEMIAGRVRDRLLTRLPKSHVFFDTGSILGGELFRERIETAAKTFDTMIVMIGEGWLGRMDGSKKRICQPEDYVRLEVRTALARGDKMIIIPVLVEGTCVPEREELPQDIRNLLMHNVMRLSNAAFDQDFDSLFACTQGKVPVSGSMRPRSALTAMLIGGGFGCVAALLVGIVHKAILGRRLAESLGGNAAAELALAAIIAVCVLAGLWVGRRR